MMYSKFRFRIPGKRRFCLFFVNNIFVGTRFFKIKRILLKLAGISIGEGTKVVGPLVSTGNLIIGKNCWIGKNLYVNGNGTVIIGDNCDIAPEVIFQTGGHIIGGSNRRAGIGLVFKQIIGDGTWIGGRTTILNDVTIGKSCVIAGCSCVTKSMANNSLIGGYLQGV